MGVPGITISPGSAERVAALREDPDIILRRQLDERGTTYEYLDGKTTDRQARVQRFQEDADCRLFLISLKAGGQGLNLTAADVVVFLEHDWNPQRDLQAMDRAHRLGQTRAVSVYRLLTRQDRRSTRLNSSH